MNAECTGIESVSLLRERLAFTFFGILGLLLIGYAIGGRGFAHHTGIHPVFLSEVLLLLGALIVLLSLRHWRPQLTSLLLIAFLAYGAVHSAFTLGTYGTDAARDAVIWLYGVVALAVAVSIRRAHLPTIVEVYRWAVPAFLIWTPIASVIRRRFQGSVPGFPFADVGIIHFKAGDFAVHLVGIAGFVVLGLMSRRLRRFGWWWQVSFWFIWAIAVFVVLNSRSALLTVLFGVLLAQALYLIRPPEGARRIAPLVLPWLMLAGLLTASSLLDFQYETSTGEVKIDGAYVANGLLSTFGITFIGDPDAEPVPESSSSAEELDSGATADDGSQAPDTAEEDSSSIGSIERTDVDDATGSEFDRTSQRQLNTRQWRLDWWRTIVDYTVFGEYFWTGKGFGVNLADSDGFQLSQDPPLRSPHNVHMTFLARMGVPGVIAWTILQAAFALSVLRVFMRQSVADSGKWIQPLAGVVLVFWAAVMINSSFDVYLEGPQGGIWFWSVFGLGLALIGFDEERGRSAETRIWA